MKARQLALCGMLAALAVTVLLLGGVIPAAAFTAPLLAMAVLLPVLEEFGGKAAGISYAAAAILTLLLAADRETAFVYLFFGWYPIARPRIAKLPGKLLRTGCRLAVCNGAIWILYGVILRGLGLTADLEGSPVWLNGLLLVLGNVVFLLLDLCLYRLTNIWRFRLRRRFFRQ